MTKIQDIFAIQDLGKRISALKKRGTPIPDVEALLSEWDVSKHGVMLESQRPKRKVLVKEATIETDASGKDRKIDAQYDFEEVNRIAIPFQQDIVNIHTAFTVGREPDLECDTNNGDEDVVFKIVRALEKDNKVKHLNKKVVRAWLSETEVAEYWYAVEDLGFWKRIEAKVKKDSESKKEGEKVQLKNNGAKLKLKCKLLSPFLGDTLYPLFDAMDNMVAFSRSYKRKEGDKEVEYFQTITDTLVDVYKKGDDGWIKVEDQSFPHAFGKLPVIYSRRKDGAIYKQVSHIIKRVESLLSDFAECIDHHFFPKTIIKGDITGIVPSEKSHTIKLDGDADVRKLTWQQAPDNIKLELETHFNQIYSRTQTPDVSFENVKGVGGQLSGKAFRYVFMGSHMAVENHAEDLELYLQRRYNFLVHAVGKINTAYAEASETIEISPVIVPYLIDDLENDVSIARSASGGEAIASKRTLIKLANLVEKDKIDEEIRAMAEEEARQKEYSNFPVGGNY